MRCNPRRWPVEGHTDQEIGMMGVKKSRGLGVSKASAWGWRIFQGRTVFRKEADS